MDLERLASVDKAEHSEHLAAAARASTHRRTLTSDTALTYRFMLPLRLSPMEIRLLTMLSGEPLAEEPSDLERLDVEITRATQGTADALEILTEAQERLAATSDGWRPREVFGKDRGAKRKLTALRRKARREAPEIAQITLALPKTPEAEQAARDVRRGWARYAVRRRVLKGFVRQHPRMVAAERGKERRLQRTQTRAVVGPCTCGGWRLDEEVRLRTAGALLRYYCPSGHDVYVRRTPTRQTFAERTTVAEARAFLARTGRVPGPPPV